MIAPAAPRTRCVTALPTWSRTDTYITILLTVASFVTRFAGVGIVNDKHTPVFDEKHYAPQAFDMVHSWIWPLIGGIEFNPGFGLVVHPPLGKQLMAIGEALFGYTPLGWRVIPAFFGSLTVTLIWLFGREVTKNRLAGLIAGFIALFDGVLLIGSRFGLLDIFLVFFVVAGAFCLAKDVNQVEKRYATAFDHRVPEALKKKFGPRFGFRWWRFTAGVCLGLALSVKWSGLYYMAFFGLFSVVTDALLRRRYNVKHPWFGAAFKDGPAAFASLVIMPVLIYLYSWRAWFANETSIWRHALQTGDIPDGSFLRKLPEALAGFAYYHQKVLEFHASLTSSSGHHHPWDSKPWAWLVAARPVLYYSNTDIPCGENTCREMIFLFGTPPIWWMTVPAVIIATWMLIIHRDRRLALPLIGFAASFFPWLIAYDRQMYFFYAEAILPFTAVLIGFICMRIARIKPQPTGFFGRPVPSLRQVTWGQFCVAVYLGLVAAGFIYWGPILYGTTLTNDAYNMIMWLPVWH